jgi:hypothetical protein
MILINVLLLKNCHLVVYDIFSFHLLGFISKEFSLYYDEAGEELKEKNSFVSTFGNGTLFN